MGGTYYKFDGLEQAEKNLSKLIEQTYPAEFKQMVVQVAYELQGLVKSNTPVDTSRLRDGWKVGSIKKKGDTYYIEVFNNIEYVEYVEEGHRTRGGGRVIQGVKMFEVSLTEINNALPNYLSSWLSDFMRTHQF
ncbi:MAG: HK97 gp10 family phage protein [bacterium]